MHYTFYQGKRKSPAGFSCLRFLRCGLYTGAHICYHERSNNKGENGWESIRCPAFAAPADPKPPPNAPMKTRRAYLMLTAMVIMVISAFMEPGLLKTVLLMAVGIGLIFDIIYNVWKRRKES